MAGIRVEPYWELTFDADGDMAPGERDALVRGVGDSGITDLVVFAHGWNNRRSAATLLYDQFFAPFPGVLADAPSPVRLGYAGVFWPSMRFTDEPIPDFPPLRPAPAAGPGLDPATLRALADVLPGSEATLDRLAELLERRPEDEERLAEFVALVRGLVPERLRAAAGDRDPYGHDMEPDAGPPAMFTADPRAVCEAFAEALAATGAPAAELLGGLGDAWEKLWRGALELLRQASYWEMKRRAGTVGRAGLGPVLALLAADPPGPRIHLVGHSFGGRLVAFAAQAVPEHVECVHSLTLLQGAFSHYAFAPRLPFALDRGGALKDLHRRIRGPLLCCHSGYDEALRVLYPVASRVSGDNRSMWGADRLANDPRWGAMGHDGVQAVPGTTTLTLARALTDPLPESGCVNVDASAVVRRGGPPSGAHSDICHGELARLILRAGRLVG
ncbi:serine-threonine protein kinase [Streptomyces cinnamoneus]|nr:serine-threonine protein kinase [Streptomyces cinnamoneus]